MLSSSIETLAIIKYEHPAQQVSALPLRRVLTCERSSLPRCPRFVRRSGRDTDVLTNHICLNFPNILTLQIVLYLFPSQNRVCVYRISLLVSHGGRCPTRFGAERNLRFC